MLSPCRSSLLGALDGALRALGVEATLAEIAGLSGLGFRLQLDAEVTLASAHAFPWAQELPAALSRLGCDVDLVHAGDTDPALPAKQRQALALAGRGTAVAWGVHLPEFGLLLGADGERLRVSGVLDGRGGDDHLEAARLGRGDVPILFVLLPRRRPDHDADAARRAALLEAARLLSGATSVMGGFVSGLAAWETWRGALQSGRIDPTGHAYLAQIVAEGRALAATWLAGIGSAAAAPLRRSADALCELAGSWSYPLPEGAALTTRARAEHERLLGAAADAEREALSALTETVDRERRARAAAGVTLADATPADAARLFACLRDLPLAGLGPEADELRPRLDGGPAFRAKLARVGAETVGHVYYAELVASGAAVEAEGKWLSVYCAWVARERRGAGIGRRLFDAVLAEARAAGCRGLLVEATAQPVFLHHAGYEALGFEEVDRLEDDARLLGLPAGAARLTPPARPTSARLPVVVAEGRPCPLLLRAARNVAAAAAGAGVELTVRGNPPHGIEIGGRRLPLQYVPLEAAAVALPEAARAWQKGRP